MMVRKDSSGSVTSGDGDKSVDSKKGKLRGFEQMIPLPDDFVPSDDDVLVGRGKICKEATGNKRFKDIVSTKLDAYLAASTRMDKTKLIDEVIAQVRRNSPQGGFVKQHKETKKWFEVGDFLSKEKTAQAFRDALHEYYSSSNPAKKKRNLKRKVNLNEEDPVKTKVTKSVSAPQLHIHLKSATPTSRSDTELNADLYGPPRAIGTNLAGPGPNFNYGYPTLGQPDGYLGSAALGGTILRDVLEPTPIADSAAFAMREEGSASLALGRLTASSPPIAHDQWLTSMDMNALPFGNPNFYSNVQEQPQQQQMNSLSVSRADEVAPLPAGLASALGYPDLMQPENTATQTQEDEEDTDIFDPIPLSKYDETMFSKFT